ncbi:RNA-directed DNA polymerase from mobile element jockey [Eumeta japonica]|uniref:RNA-directed DNA polymerase from mobile element jockey n=1 Tax=Eumeta variegata TaxID=151549 RepID=A0A4C1Y6L0_EUMVA|nr:RNA-directed DNA polymerase from mobile element jockey [Eumeta japonica]
MSNHRSFGVRRYDAKTRAEVIAEHLAEQFTPNPPATSPNLQEHHAQRPGPDGVSIQKGNSGHEQSVQRNTPHWSLPGGVENYNDTKAGKDPRKPENVRPITLLSHVAKTFERALLTKLRLFLTPRQEQYGFREGHSTTLQLIRVLHYLASERNCDRYTVAVFLDMEKAFDRVWHDGLIYKLIDTSLPPALTKVVANFLQRRSFCVAVDDVLSAHAR